MTDESLTPAELERFSRIPREDVAALVAEVRRLRSLFTEADLESLGYAIEDMGYADSNYCVGDAEHAESRRRMEAVNDLAARIRRAIGEPVRYIGQPQADAIIQEMIDDGTYTPSAEERPISDRGDGE